MLSTVTVDVGTTSVKLGLSSTDGRVLRSTSSPTPTLRDAWGEVYDLPALLGLVTGFTASLPDDERAGVRRLALTGVGESGALVRPDTSLASPVVLWHDHRGAAHLEHLTPADRSLVYRTTGLPVNANYGLSKAAWAVARSGSDGGAQWLNVVEVLAALLTGQRWSEPSLASRTMALDLRTATWSAPVCDLVGLDTSVFPELRPADVGAPLTARATRSTGLSGEVLVHVAGHDHVVGAVGAGLQPGELLNSTGTTEGLLALDEAPRLDADAEASKLANGFAATGRAYALFASVPTGGSAFATLQSMLGMSADRLQACTTALHTSYLAGQLDLDRVPLVLPQFRGSPPPTKHAWARGAVAGLGSGTTDEDLVLGCFLGLALQLADVQALFGPPPALLKVIGPASRNPLWLQLKADVLGVPLGVARLGEVVSRGAQALASGTRPDWEACQPVTVPVDPRGSEAVATWREEVLPQWEHLKSLPDRRRVPAGGRRPHPTTGG